METPERGHGREVDAEPQLQSDEGNEGDLPHKGTVAGTVSSEGCGEVTSEDEPDCPHEKFCRTPTLVSASFE